jgi:hypothetical protein
VSDGQAAVLSADQREVPGQALADALRYRTPDGECAGCDERPAWLRDDHAAGPGPDRRLPGARPRARDREGTVTGPCNRKGLTALATRR